MLLQLQIFQLVPVQDVLHRLVLNCVHVNDLHDHGHVHDCVHRGHVHVHVNVRVRVHRGRGHGHVLHVHVRVHDDGDAQDHLVRVYFVGMTGSSKE